MIARLLSRRYRSAAPFGATTADGVPLVGVRLGEGPAALVLCHGFMGWHRKASIVSFAERLAERFLVYVFDLRGHGGSAGVCTYGDREYLDVDAVVGLARRERGLPVATLGASMGGIAVIRQAALGEPPDAVMAVSTPARWEGHATAAVRRVTRMTATPSGRRMMRALGFRLTDTWGSP
ncbi:MAG TPA: alpha/beta fold hydrolase, partial [Actinomycetota bacterium]